MLFAAAAAQFSALAVHAPQTPRLILLDDAFAKVDEPTHGRLLGMLVELDLDFMLTSERVWAASRTSPSSTSTNACATRRNPGSPPCTSPGTANGAASMECDQGRFLPAVVG